jgi:ketosteroid isomerase-like protein
MHPNEQVLQTFYSRFAERDHAGMIACYAPGIEFSDPVFALSGKKVGAMWHMLCEAGKDLAVTVSDIHADDARGNAHWEARYTFSITGRKVHNIIDATFRFENGKIVWHQDRFDFWRWARMALGSLGLFLGWTPLVRNRVRSGARRNLERFIASHPQYQ